MTRPNSGPDIFAELTPPGRGGISTLALLGPHLVTVLPHLFRPRRQKLPAPGELVYGHIIDESGEAVDEIILRRLPDDPGESPAAPDREAAADSLAAGGPAADGLAPDWQEFEVHCHGGPAAVRAVAARLTAAGLRQLNWPEFLRARAALRGISRIALDGQLLLPAAATLPVAAVIAEQAGGLLAARLTMMMGLIATGPAANGVAAAVALRDTIAAYDEIGRWLERPPRVAIMGTVNVGKSSLLNRLVGRERTIVTEIPGTTRDVVTELVSLGGLPVLLADTAGLRDTDDAVEQLGIERARAEVFRADLILFLVDLSQPLDAAQRRELEKLPPARLVVGTKADLNGSSAVTVDVATSATTGLGLEQLAALILERLAFRWPAPGEAVPFTADQAAAFRAAEQALTAGDSHSAACSLRSLTEPCGR